MTDKHIIDKDNGEVRKVEDARPFIVASGDPNALDLPPEARRFLIDDNAPVIETPRVVRSKFGAWRLDFDASEGKTTIELDGHVSEFNVSTQDLAVLARLLPAFLAKVVE